MGPLTTRCSPRVLAAVIAAAAGITALAQGPTYNVGRTPTVEESQACCLPVTPDGTGLPLAVTCYETGRHPCRSD